MASIDFEQEVLITLAAAARKVPGRVPGKPVHTATLARWATRGVNGRQLETLKIGGRLFTSVEALSRFVSALNTSPQHENHEVRPTSRKTTRRSLVRKGLA